MKDPKDERVLSLVHPSTGESEYFALSGQADMAVFTKIDNFKKNQDEIAKSLKLLEDMQEEHEIKRPSAENNYEISYKEDTPKEIKLKYERLYEKSKELLSHESGYIPIISSMILTPIGEIPDAYKNKVEYISDFICTMQIFYEVIDFFYKFSTFTTEYRQERISKVLTRTEMEEVLRKKK